MTRTLHEMAKQAIRQRAEILRAGFNPEESVFPVSLDELVCAYPFEPIPDIPRIAGLKMEVVDSWRVGR